MNGYGAYRAQALASARETARRVIKSLLPLVRPERRPGSLPALPPSRKEVIKGDPSRYGFVKKVRANPETDGTPPWGPETATFPAITPELEAAIESGAYSSARVLRPEGGAAA